MGDLQPIIKHRRREKLHVHMGVWLPTVTVLRLNINHPSDA